ncbi:MAG: acyl-CoA dehydrogenase, partial [Ornithinibacter sp.]
MRGSDWFLDDLAERARGRDVGGSLELAHELSCVARDIAADPWLYVSTLATLGSVDLTTARAVEPHLDAVAILAQAGDPDLGTLGADGASTFGVYAARAPGTGLRLARDGGTVTVSGTKAWCSLATDVSHALVTVDDAGSDALAAVPLRHPGVAHAPSTWVSRGLTEVTTGSLTLDAVPAVLLGAPGWYLTRPGFAWGGIGVAAVWFGAAAALAGRLTYAALRRAPDQVALMHLGTADRVLHTSLLALRHAAAEIAGGRAEGADGALLAARTRAVVVD